MGVYIAGTKNDTLIGKNADFSQAGAPNATSGEANGLITDGQMWIGSTALNAGGTHINVGTLTSPLATIGITYNSPNIELEILGSASGISQVGVDSTSGTGTNPVVPDGTGLITHNGAVIAAGNTPVGTVSTAPNVYQTQVQLSQALAAPDASAVGLCVFDSASFQVDSDGFVALSGSGAGQTITGDSGGALSPSSGNWNLLGNGSITTSGTGSTLTTQLTGLTNHAVLVGAGTSTITKLAVGTNGQVLLGATGADPAFATLTSTGGSITFTPGANSLNLEAGSTVPTTFNGDSGSAAPSSNIINIIGRSGSKTAATGSTVTVSSPPFSQVGSSATGVLNSGEIVTAAVTRTLPATSGLVDGDLVILTCTTAGALVVTANTGQIIRIGASASTSGGTATSTTIGDSLTLRFDATAIAWRAVSVQGNWITA